MLTCIIFNQRAHCMNGSYPPQHVCLEIKKILPFHITKSINYYLLQKNRMWKSYAWKCKLIRSCLNSMQIPQILSSTKVVYYVNFIWRYHNIWITYYHHRILNIVINLVLLFFHVLLQQHYSPGWASASFRSFLHPSWFRAATFQFRLVVILPSPVFTPLVFVTRIFFQGRRVSTTLNPQTWRTRVPLLFWPPTLRPVR